MTAKSIGVRKLKDNLSGYLKEVESGTVILVSDRDRIIAEIHKPDPSLYKKTNTLMASWVREGKVSAPKTGKNRVPRITGNDRRKELPETA